VAFLRPVFIANSGEGPLTVHGIHFQVEGVDLRIECTTELPLVVPPAEAREIFFAVHADTAALAQTDAVFTRPLVYFDEADRQVSSLSLDLYIVPTAGDVPTPTPTATPTPSPTATPTLTPSPTATPRPTPTPTPTPNCTTGGGDGVVDAADVRGCPGVLGMLLGDE
jgi:hypothetical protein